MKYTKFNKLLKSYKEKSAVKLDIGCGENKTENYIGMDIRPLKGVDIVHDLTKFPWPIPNDSIDIAAAYHLLEHIPPFYTDSHLTNLIDLLLKKKVLNKVEVAQAIGEYKVEPTFMRLMDEIWRVMKPDGKIHIVVPYAGSSGYWQDPTHCNPISEATWWYFDPLAAEGETLIGLYNIYRPKPWKIEFNAHAINGNLETILIKRREDKSYEGTQSV